MDIVYDLYPKDYILKEETPKNRGVGTHSDFSDDAEFLPDFSTNFLRKNEN